MENKKLFSRYSNSIYAKSNLLTKEEYENNADDYEFHYGNFLPTDKGTPILDIGCGAGHFLYYLKKKGCFILDVFRHHPCNVHGRFPFWVILFGNRIDAAYGRWVLPP